jgi:hypothetical protein
MRLQVPSVAQGGAGQAPPSRRSVAGGVQPDVKKRLGGAPTVRRTMALKALGLA